MISFHEFAEAFIAKKRQSIDQDRLLRVFQEADRDHDQHLTRTECLAALKQLGHVMDDNGIRRVMGMMDKNGDGRISFRGNETAPFQYVVYILLISVNLPLCPMIRVDCIKCSLTNVNQANIKQSNMITSLDR